MKRAFILIAEDNSDILDSLRLLFEMEGFTVITAENCITACEYLTQSRPDIVLTDLGMPEMTGLEFIRFIRRTPQLSNLPIIAMTAYSKKHLTAALTVGADVALHKLEGFDTLLQTVNEVLSDRIVA